LKNQNLVRTLLTSLTTTL